jgi:hypothetical protein
MALRGRNMWRKAEGIKAGGKREHQGISESFWF